jgi:hypothetical protein
MRSDLVVGWVAYDWLRQHMPDIVKDWDFEVEDDVKAFGDRMYTMYDRIGDILASQALLANSMVEAFGLQDMALLGAGVPSPLIPSPAQVKYYTDIDADAIDEGRKAGYNAVTVDVRDPEQVMQLQGVRDAVGTGLFHFLTPEELTQSLQNLSDAGIQRLAFNHVFSEEIGEDQQIPKNFVASMYPRSAEEVISLIPPVWKVSHLQTMKEFYQSASLALYDHLQDLPNIYYVYLLERY